MSIDFSYSDLQEAASKAREGHSQEERLEAWARMDELREEIRKRVGIVDIAVPYIRELRDS